MSELTDREAGIQAFQARNYSAAIPHLQRALEQHPSDAALHGYLGLAYNALGDHGQAAQCLREAVRRAPTSAGLFYNLGLVLEQAGNLSAARGSFDQALALDPAHAKARAALERLRPEPVSNAAPAPAVTPPAAAVSNLPAPGSAPPAWAPSVAPPPVSAPPPGETTGVVSPASPPMPASTSSAAPVSGGLPVAAVIGGPAPASKSLTASPSGKGLPRSRVVLIVAAVLAGVLVLLSVAGVRLYSMVTDAGTAKPLIAPPAKPPLTDSTGQRMPDVGHTDVASLTPLPSGSGIQVGEPVSQGADRTARAFGSGCSRWLQYTLGGQGELGKMPLWTSAVDAAHQIKKRDLQITPGEAASFAANLGVTHVAVAEVSGSRSRCILRYRLLAFPGGKEVGSPLTLTGSQAEIAAGLPGVARELCSRLGVRAPQLPSRVEEGPNALQAIGELPWQPGLDISDADARRLTQLSAASRVANLMELTLVAESRNPSSLFGSATGFLSRTPDHPLLLAETAYAFRQAGLHQVREPHGTMLSHALKQFPNNYLLHLAFAFRRQAEGRWDLARPEAESAVRCSPGNPSAWISLAGNFAEAADRIRAGATMDRMSREKLAACEELYTQQLAVLVRAVEVAPQNTRLGLQLSQAAAFAGDGKLADLAFTRVIQRHPIDSDVYSWGVQLYQPKWYQDDAKAAQMVRLTAQASAQYGDQWSPRDRVELAIELIEMRHPDVAKRVVRSSDERNMLRQFLQLNGKPGVLTSEGPEKGRRRERGMERR